MAPPAHVNSFYRTWFTIIDPCILVGTVITCILYPHIILETIVPRSLAPYQPQHAVLFHQTAALYAFSGIIYGYLLPNSRDPFVWRTVQAATLLVDLSLIAAIYVALEGQGRLDPRGWAASDWFNFLFTAWVAVLRIGFLLGVGADEEKGPSKAKKSR